MSRQDTSASSRSPQVYASKPSGYRRPASSPHPSKLLRGFVASVLLLCSLFAAGVAMNMPLSIDSIFEHPWTQFACKEWGCKPPEKKFNYEHLQFVEATATAQGNTFIFSGALALLQAKQGEQLPWPNIHLELLNNGGKQVLEYKIEPSLYLPKDATKVLSKKPQAMQFSVDTETAAVKYAMRFYAP